MEIQIIGADAAFDGLNTSLFFKDNLGRGVLVDCGATVYYELARRNMRDDIDVVLVSHEHGDHTGSLAIYGAYSRIVRQKKLIVGGIDVSELFRVQGILPDDFIPLAADDSLNVQAIPTKHIEAHGNNHALFIADSILYTGDCNENMLTTEYAKQAKIIFHDATLSERAAYAHATLATLSTAPAEIKAKTWLIHLPVHEHDEAVRLAAEHGFAGVCYNGQELEV